MNCRDMWGINQHILKKNHHVELNDRIVAAMRIFSRKEKKVSKHWISVNPLHLPPPLFDKSLFHN